MASTRRPPPAQQAAPVAARVVDDKQDTPQSWQALLDAGAVRNLRLTPEDVDRAFRESGRADAAASGDGKSDDDTFIDLYAALVSVPAIGRSLLGDTEWQRLKERLKPGQQAVLVAGNGSYSFKGSGYVRGGIFDRIEVIQDEGSFRFRDRNHQRLADVVAEGAPPRSAKSRCSWCRTTPSWTRSRPGACNSWCSACSA